MTLIEFKLQFEEREKDINSYISLLKTIELLKSNEEKRFEIEHINILKGNTYIILYNYIEGVISGILKVLSIEIVKSNKYPYDFTENIQKEWVKHMIQSNDINMNINNRIDKCIDIINYFKGDYKLTLEIHKGGGGNFDDKEIIGLLKRLGISKEINRAVKERIYHCNGTVLTDIKNTRNKLAHGEISFQFIGKDKTICVLEELADATIAYMNEVINNFSKFIEQKQYIKSYNVPSNSTQ